MQMNATFLRHKTQNEVGCSVINRGDACMRLLITNVHCPLFEYYVSKVSILPLMKMTSNVSCTICHNIMNIQKRREQVSKSTEYKNHLIRSSIYCNRDIIPSNENGTYI